MRLLGPSNLKALGSAGGIGFEMVALLLIGLYGGKWLDQHFGTDPIFKTLGLFFGIGAGFYSLFKLARRLSPPSQQAETEEGDEGGQRPPSTLGPEQSVSDENKVSDSSP